MGAISFNWEYIYFAPVTILLFVIKMGTVQIVLYILSTVNLITCGYPPTGDEVVPGSVLLPASRRGRYLANIVRRQAVDGTGIKFNKDADRMNAEAKKKVDVLSEELLPYIIAEQERRTTLHKRVMTAIQNGEKGVTIAEMRNKPPLIIRKGLMYRCPANRAPVEPDGSGVLMCDDNITPTQIMYDACLSAEDKELYNAENKYFFCNRHKIEGPDLPRNGTTVYGCAPIERTSFNYTTTKCSLEDTEDVVVHYRYYPDRTYKYVTELDPDREVCDHWNPCQIGYIFSLPSPDMATPASELWPDAPFDDYEKIVPPIPEDSINEYVHPSVASYTSSPRTINIPHSGRRSLNFNLEKIQVKNGKGKSRKISPNDYSVKVSTFSITITLSFEEFSPKFFGTYHAFLNINNKSTSTKFLILAPSNMEVNANTVDCLHGQKLNISAIPINCDNCRVHGLMVRAHDNNVYNIPSGRYKIKQAPNRQLYLEINMKDPQPQDFGDYFALIENSRGQEERHKVLTVRVITLNRFDAACDVRGNYNNITKYECKDCQLTDILCNGQSVLAAGRVTIIPQSQQISYNFPSFADSFSCVYMGFFKAKETVYKKVVAVIENNSVKIPEVVKVAAPKEDDNLDQEIMFEAESDSCDVKEVIVNGINLEQSTRRSNPLQAMFQVSQNSINIHVGPFLEEYTGMYQARFQCGDDTITKNIMEVTLATEGGDDDGGTKKDDDDGTKKDDNGGTKKDDDKGTKKDDDKDTKKDDDKDTKKDIQITVTNTACKKDTPCKIENSYVCETCKWKSIKCNNEDVTTTLKCTDKEKKIACDIEKFEDKNSCVYIGVFEVDGKTEEKPIAVIENDAVKISAKGDTTVKLGEPLSAKTTFEAEVEVLEVRVNGEPVPVKGADTKPPYFELDAEKKSITITVDSMTEKFAGFYQAKLKGAEGEITKTIMEVKLAPSEKTKDEKQDGAGGGGEADIQITVTNTACKKDTPCKIGNSYVCETCKWKSIKCNNEDVTTTLKCTDTEKKIACDIEKFEDKNSCVYIGVFEVNDKTEEKPIAVIENDAVKISAKGDTTVKLGEPLSAKTTFEAEVEVLEVRVNGEPVPVKGADTKPPYFELDAEKKSITITVDSMTEKFAGFYQAKIKGAEGEITKTIMEVKLAPSEKTKDDAGGGGEETKDGGKDNPDLLYAASCEVDKDCSVEGKKYPCEKCTLKLEDITCNEVAAAADMVTVDDATKTIKYTLAKFTNAQAGVCMAQYTEEGKTDVIKKPIAVIETVKITKPDNKPVPLEGNLEETVKFEPKEAEVVEVRVNGKPLLLKSETATAPPYYEVGPDKDSIIITVKPMTEDYAGHYQAKFKLADKEITKNILDVKLPPKAGRRRRFRKG